MKLSKAQLKDYKNFEWIYHGGIGRDLLEHIDALEQELDSANAWLKLFSDTSKGELLNERIELKQENLQRLEEVKGLQRRVESLTKFSNQKVKDVRRLNDEVSKAWIAYGTENEAKVLLEATLERAMLDHQPVVLPKKQVDAINFFKNPPKGIYTNWGNDTIIDFVLRHGTYADDYELPLTALREISFDILLKALVNGCTVEQEQTPEDMVLNYYNTITPKDWKYDGNGNDPVYIERNAIRTTCYLLGKTIDGLNSK